MQRIISVENVNLQIDDHTPPHVVIHVEGKVSSSGWTSAELGAWHYIEPPADGIQDFDFTAEPPTGISLTVISPIAASLHVPVDVDNYWGTERPLKGVRIHAQSGSKEELLTNAGPIVYSFENSESLPWDAFKIGKKGSVDDPISSLVGHFARIYHEGDAVTYDLRPQRINIALQPGTSIISRVWFG